MPALRPLLAGALLIRLGSSVYWTFAVDLVASEGGASASAARLVLAVVGAASLAGAFSGDLVERLGARPTLVVSTSPRRTTSPSRSSRCAGGERRRRPGRELEEPAGARSPKLLPSGRFGDRVLPVATRLRKRLSGGRLGDGGRLGLTTPHPAAVPSAAAQRTRRATSIATTEPRAAAPAGSVALSGSLALLALAPGSWVAVVPSELRFGAAYDVLLAVEAIWSARVYAGRPATGLAAVTLMLATGLLLGPAAGGIMVAEHGLPATFLVGAGGRRAHRPALAQGGPATGPRGSGELGARGGALRRRGAAGRRGTSCARRCCGAASRA